MGHGAIRLKAIRDPRLSTALAADQDLRPGTLESASLVEVAAGELPTALPALERGTHRSIFRPSVFPTRAVALQAPGIHGSRSPDRKPV